MADDENVVAGEGQITVFVKSIAGKTRTVVVEKNATIASIKEQIQQKEGLNPEEQRMIFAGKNLEDNRTLMDYNIGNNQTIHLVMRVRGGH